MRLLKGVAWIMDFVPFSPSRVQPTVDEICELAIKETGLTDFGDNNLWRESVQCYLDETWEKCGTNAFRRLTTRDEMKKRLVKRLRVLDAFKRNKEIKDIELPRAIIIVGMPRTGSTILHQC